MTGRIPGDPRQIGPLTEMVAVSIRDSAILLLIELLVLFSGV
jgi:hypothetical protein